MRQKNFRLRQLAVAALGAVTAVSGIAVLGVGAAGAATTPTVTYVTPTNPAVALTAGATKQAGSNLSFTITDGFAQADKLVINSMQCLTATNYVGFAAVPTVTVTGAKGNSSSAIAPTFTAALAQQSGDGAACAGVNDQLVLTVGNTDSATATGNTWTIALSNVSYDVGSAVVAGPVTGANYSATVTDSAAYVQGATGGSTTGVVGTNLNVFITPVSVTADNPPVLIQPTSQGGATTTISPITLTETGPGLIPSGNYVCVVLNSQNPLFPSPTFANTNSVPNGTASVDSASGAVIGNSGALTQIGTTTATTSTGFSFLVKTASTTAGTFTVSGLSVASAIPGAITVGVTTGTTPNCATLTATYATSATVASAFGTSRIFGQTADGTAAAQLASQFPPSSTNKTCPGTGGFGLGVAAFRPVVLATDSNFPDALSAAYMASKLGTGVLLTPTATLSNSAQTALRLEGITNVFIVGGPLAVSSAVVTQLQATTSYNCGGTAARKSLLGTSQSISVTQIYGQTAYDTAQSVAQYFGPSGVGTGSFPGAYPTSTTGTSTYNTTTGLSGTLAPASAASTKVAILAVGSNYPDAMAASGMAYANDWPVLLTQQASLAPQAEAAIVNLGIQQVVVMGGPLAISDSVVTQLEGLGVSVLRIAGTDYTDTSQLLAQFELNSNGLNWAAHYPSLILPGTYGMIVSRGDFYADALAGSLVSGMNHEPILLTMDPNTVGTGIPAFLQAEASQKNQVTSLTIFGGPLAVSAGTQVNILLSISANSTVS